MEYQNWWNRRERFRRHFIGALALVAALVALRALLHYGASVVPADSSEIVTSEENRD